MPGQVGAFHLVSHHVFPHAEEGSAYRFSNGSATRVTVFVYPMPSDVRHGNDPQKWVSAEGAKFPQTFPIGIQRGWYDATRLAYSDPEPVMVDSITIPGHAVGAATRKGTEINVELEYLYLIRAAFVKVRATIPGTNWTESGVPQFARALAVALWRAAGRARP